MLSKKEIVRALRLCSCTGHRDPCTECPMNLALNGGAAIDVGFDFSDGTLCSDALLRMAADMIENTQGEN